MPTKAQALFRKMHNCTLCTGLELGPKPLFKLSPDVKILIAGQAPGRITHKKGRPFDDPSGDRLRQWLGLDRQTFYHDDRIGIFPMALCFPGSTPAGDKPPRTECAEAWRTDVMETLTQVQLTLVLGRYAIAWHLPALKKLSVTDAVKQAAQAPDGTFVLPHPSPRNNRWLAKNDWFEQAVIPRIQAKVTQILAPDHT
ncbi:uracil-DNA glycosylase [Amylibacter marinus]|uniref:Uracil-DNA glycosylase n=1 Tax=Amylibacter marinus TaxID=1475483 RepID=A0ABQ5VY29_9RHOB|nr:uracil-DNA glycosylase family protein [Amylibacter marinus]GLQ36255.1 uracil-DNA glycosylase [Amylibacter marinus]